LKVEATLVHGDWAELAEKSVARSIDALAVGAGVPAPMLIDIERKAKVRYLPLTRQEIATLRLTMPELSASVVAAGSYPPDAVTTRWPVQICRCTKRFAGRSGLAIVNTVFASNERMIRFHRGGGNDPLEHHAQ
jgi:TRAP-type uncharacterized transport system substrate-binding protein